MTSTLNHQPPGPTPGPMADSVAGHLPVDPMAGQLPVDLPDAAFDALYAAMATVVFDRGAPTDVVDSAVLTCGTDPAIAALGPVELVPPDPGAGPHPLAATPTGSGLATLLEVFDPATLTDAALVDYVAASARIAAWAESRAAAGTAELTARCARLRGVGDGPDQVPAAQVAAAELAAALRLSPVAARTRVELARDLARLPLTRAALAGGAIDLVRARAVADALGPLDQATARAVETRVITRAPDQTAPMLRAALRRAVIAADPAAAQARHLAAVRGRGVWRETLDHGISRLEWVAPTEQIETAHQWITGLARQAQTGDRGHGAVRTLDQCRSDVLADLAEHALRHHDLPRHHGRAPQIHVVVAATTLLGLDDEPAELAGAGPLTAHTARRIATDGTWRRLLTDPAGRLVDLSPDTHEPTQAQRDHVTTRDRTCQGPGCRTPAARCDLDHTLEWPTGPTSIGNLSALCRAHHRLKTLTDTHLTRHPDPDPDPTRGPDPGRHQYGHGDLRWTLPTGQTHPRPPDPVLDHPALDPPTLRDALHHALRQAPTSPPEDDIPPF